MSPRRFALPLLVIVTMVSLSAALSASKKEKEKTATISVTVLKDYNGKPIKNAAVILHSVSVKGHQASGGLELKTNTDGYATIDSIPYGKIRIQIIVEGFQTYGEDFEISEPEKSITVKMQSPHGQFSIYADPTPTPAASTTPTPAQ